MLSLLLSSLCLASAHKIEFPWEKDCKHSGLITIKSHHWLSFIPPKDKLLEKFDIKIDALGMEISKNLWDLKKIKYCVTDYDGGARFILSNKHVPLVGHRDYCAFQIDSNPNTVDQHGMTQIGLGVIKSDGLACSVSKATPTEGYQEAFVITVA